MKVCRGGTFRNKVDLVCMQTSLWICQGVGHRFGRGPVSSHLLHQGRNREVSVKNYILQHRHQRTSWLDLNHSSPARQMLLSPLQQDYKPEGAFRSDMCAGSARGLCL